MTDLMGTQVQYVSVDKIGIVISSSLKFVRIEVLE